MALYIDTASRLPIYQQLAQQIREGIARGELQPDEALPSVRQLSRDLVVNPNTVARAFQELERAGIVTPRRGLGMEVTAEAPGLCRARRQEIVRERIRAALREAASSALTPDQIRKIVDEELTRVNGKRNREKP